MQQTIQVCGKNLLGTINDILDYSKFEEGMMSFERVPFDLVRSLILAIVGA